MGILASTYFIWTLSQNTVYNDAIREKNQLESDVLSENVQVTNTTYVVNGNDNINVSTNINNIGSLSVQFTTLWAYASNATYANYHITNLSNVNVQGGANLFLSVNVTVGGLCPGSAYSFASWLITGRGNVVPLQKATSSYTNIVMSNTTQGIGSLMMNFQNFTYYIVNGSNFLSGYPNGNSGYLVNSNGNPIAFRVIITNLDQNQRNITLTAPSVLFSIFPTTPQQVRGSYWYVVNVDKTTGKIFGTYTDVTLVYNTATELYFASAQPGTFYSAATCFTGTAPVNLALIGQIGDAPFGQNIPFVATKIIS